MNERDIFLSALEIADPAKRAEWLAGQCGNNADLRKRVDELIQGHNAAGAFLDQPAAPDVTGAFNPAPKRAELVPGDIFAGRYKIRERLGEGGMGVVYVAEQTQPVQRRVALKIIKADMSTDRLLARFEAERQALALMDHPNIAKVFDAGVDLPKAQGRPSLGLGVPYFVMELIKGVPITKYCDDAKLTPKQRLELFIPVCQAVQHAHQKGIIHRDLKPSNVIVGLYDGRPVPKVIDFGVAKATGTKLTDKSVYTEVGSIVGTLEYMSPEQAEFNNLDIDTRSDIYALGVLLYELLTGTVPFSRKELQSHGFAEMLRIIKEVEPQKPSTRLSGSGSLPSLAAVRQIEPKKLSRLFRGELDWMVMKALEKDRSRRYETANGFAMDIQRYLADEPVLAGPPSATYRMKKFVKRNKAQVVAASLVLLALLAGITGTTFGLVRARQQESLAREESQAKELARQAEAEQRQIAEANEAKAIAAADAERKAKAREAEQRATAEKARDRTRDVLDAMTSSATGDSLSTQKEISADQKKFLTEVLTYYREFAGEKADDRLSRSRHARAAFRVGLIEFRLGRQEESAAAFRIARDGYTSLAADFPAQPAYRRDLAQSLNNLGLQLADLGKRPEAEEQYRKALAIREKLPAEIAEPKYRRDLAESHSNLGTLLNGLGKRPEAEEQYRKALAIQEKLAAESPAVPLYRQELAHSHHNLGNLLAGLGNRREAEEQYRKALSIREKLAADFPAVPAYRLDLARSYFTLGFLLNGLGQRPEAEEQYRKSLSIREQLAADFPAVPAYRQDLAASHNNLGNLLRDLGQQPEAVDQHRKGLAIREKLAADFPTVPEYRQELAGSYSTLLRGLGQRPEAEQQVRKALAIQEKLAADFPAVPEYRQVLAKHHSRLASLLTGLGKLAEAEDEHRKALAIREKLAADFPAVPAYRHELALTHNSLGNLIADLGKQAEAEEQIRKGLAIREKLAADFPAVPAYRVDLGASYCNYGILVRDGGNAAESLKWFDRAIECLQTVHDKEPRDVTAKAFLRNSHYGRARAYDRLQKFAEAVKDWERTIALSSPGEQPRYRASRATSRLQAGMVAEAVAEVADLTKTPNWNDDQWYDFACVYSVASVKITEKKQEYADRAMELLQKAVKAGYKNATHMAKDTDLDSLRGREDFKKLLAEIAAKAPPPPEPAQPPRERK